MNKTKIVEYYNIHGYTLSCEYLKKLNSTNKISLMERAKYLDLIVELEMKPKRRNKGM
tara:strand:- start:1253 stop:1426 length:174 start_codon:yes stop_codon:yes gene_type:complete